MKLAMVSIFSHKNMIKLAKHCGKEQNYKQMRTIKISYTQLLLIFGLALSSCNNFLDVKPEDKFLGNQVYNTEVGIYNVLNGIYIDMAERSLYGEYLSSVTMDVLAQYYTSDRNNDWYKYQTYAWDDEGVKSTFAGIWNTAYNKILGINAFIGSLEKSDILAQDKKDLLTGEAIGLRALLHFDLLRIFGPIYATDSTVASIPYTTLTDLSVTPLLPANSVVDKILADLSTAETLLQNDTVRTAGKVGELVGELDDFFRARQYRMNYFAVKALEARVHLYRDNKAKAAKAAKAVINEASSFFPWTNRDDIFTDPTMKAADHVFSTEVLFGMDCYKLYNVYRARFKYTLRNEKILLPFSGRLEETFENNTNDYRFEPCWRLAPVGAHGRTFVKFEDFTENGIDAPSFANYIPIIRLSEMYLIAAECESNETLALSYLNTLRYNRGLNDLAPGTNITAELDKEYKREFWGEGQLFFYYKRNNKSKIPNGARPSGNINMSSTTYVVPIPDAEMEQRN
ncbi:MAG: RagB/SusD family nutrient uptake outer membrane protein [Bacteroidales bacterium]